MIQDCGSSGRCRMPVGSEQAPRSGQAQPAASDGGAVDNGIGIPLKREKGDAELPSNVNKELDALMSQRRCPNTGSGWEALPECPCTVWFVINLLVGHSL